MKITLSSLDLRHSTRLDFGHVEKKRMWEEEQTCPVNPPILKSDLTDPTWLSFVRVTA